MTTTALTHPAVHLPPFHNAPNTLWLAGLAVNQLESMYYWATGGLVPGFGRDAAEALKDELLGCLSLPAEIWQYGYHPWLLLRVAAAVEHELPGGTASVGRGVGLQALTTVLTAGAVTFHQCCTHPDGAIRTLAIRWAARLPGSLRRGP